MHICFPACTRSDITTYIYDISHNLKHLHVPYNFIILIFYLLFKKTKEKKENELYCGPHALSQKVVSETCIQNEFVNKIIVSNLAIIYKNFS